MRTVAVLLVTLGAAAALVAVAEPAAARTFVPVNGSGSTWSQIAVDTWRADVRASGLVVNFNGNGSSAGRQDWIGGVSDFSVSEIPFQPRTVINGRPTTDEIKAASSRPYAYLPIVAGGTAFMYHLTVAGHRVTDLRLSGETLTKIFTGSITRWNDPQITREYGHALPARSIVPVIRSDGSGTSAQFTRYMSVMYPSLWNAFCSRYAGIRAPCPLQSFYPVFPHAVGQAGSNGVSNYVAADYGEGAITYVEAAYPLRLGFPVVKVLNGAGYYSLPTASNVSVALTRARINKDLTQNLDDVYRSRDPRAYPLSSYSYMIVPTELVSPFSSSDKGYTLSTFIDHFLCEGQRKAEVLGYAPLPEVLVKAGQAQLRRIPGAITPRPVSRCNNPALSILRTAPQPDACDRAGVACSAHGRPEASGGTGGGTGRAGGSARGAQGGAPAGSAAAAQAGKQAAGASSGAQMGALAGQPQEAAQQLAEPVPVTLTSVTSPVDTRVLSGLAVAELLLLVLVPPGLVVLRRRLREGTHR